MLQHNPQDDYSTYLQEEKEQKQHPLYRKDENAEAVFMHHNLVKLSPVEMVDWTKANKGSRMWGDKASTIDRFKVDFEKSVWEELLWVACDYGDSLVNWNEDICASLMDHWGNILAKEALEELRSAFGVNKHRVAVEKQGGS